MGAREVTAQTRAKAPTLALLNHDPASLVWARKNVGWTQSKLATAVQVSKGHMSQIESGKRNATPAILNRIAVALNCPRSVLERKRPAPGQAAS